MIQKILFKLLILSAFMASGCMTTVKKEGIGVRVVRESSFVKDCKYIQTVDSSSAWGGFAATGIGYSSAMNELKNNAGEIGADTLLIVILENSMGGTNMSGDAYKCNLSN